MCYCASEFQAFTGERIMYIITGSNRGIGLELCRQLLAQGKHVIAACRSSSPELDALAKSVNTSETPKACRIEIDIDVSQDSVVATLKDRLSDVPSISVVINNAGVLHKESFDSLDFDTIRHQFEVNTLGPLRVTQAIEDKLGKGSKVAIVTSRMGSISDNQSGGYYGYRSSKSAVNSVGMSLARDLKDRDIAVVLLHPGYVKTAMTGNNGEISPETSAKGLLERISALTIDTTGTFWHASGEQLPW